MSVSRASRLRILQIATADAGGGAARVAVSLTHAFRASGHQTWLAVGQKSSDDPDVFMLDDDDRLPYRLSGYQAMQAKLRRAASLFPNRGLGLLSRSLRMAAHPRAAAAHYRGNEDFEFPGTYGLLDLQPERPDIVHCHNLHGGYFDLRALSWLSQTVPTVLTLHDSWLLTGHCSHSFDCDRWKTGCGQCPYLSTYPAVRRDATAENWLRKREIYTACRLHVATPSQWLMRRVEQSMLFPALLGTRVIPHGVDLSVFRPDDKLAARAALGIPSDAQVILSPAKALLGGPWTDHSAWQTAAGIVARQHAASKTLFIGLGQRSPRLQLGDATAEFVGYQQNPDMVARYHRAADVYVHPATADTFPTMILEALACGTPVVATTVGGIPEQIRAAGISAIDSADPDALADSTGVLVAGSDAVGLANAVLSLLRNDASRARLGANAARDAHNRFGLDEQVEAYLDLYLAIMDEWNCTHSARCIEPTTESP
jgi:glycosyltransferase involved in cell wall biosynthesis